LLLFPVLLTWATDGCAYFVGRGWGRHKLCPRVSPHKTIEGAVAGAVGAVLVGVVYAPLILRHAYGLPFDAVSGGTAGLLISVVGQVGDLAKSVLKREAGVKDAGRIFPGHGGVIDRFDSLFFALPVAYGFLTFVLSI
jgi:phosphatidate cytidylyltransferase